jgi:hypothetical protein
LQVEELQDCTMKALLTIKQDRRVLSSVPRLV